MSAHGPDDRARQQGVGLRFKILLPTALLCLAICAVLTIQAAHALRQEAFSEFESKGTALASSLAASSQESLLSGDSARVQGFIDDYRHIRGVGYVYVVDEQGRVIAHTFSPAFPVGFQNQNPITDATQASRIKILEAPGLHALDIAVPILGGTLGTAHVGMNLDQVEALVARLRREALLAAGLTLLAGLLLLWLNLSAVVRPIQRLTEVSAKIVREGDLSQRIEVTSRDEVGQLGTTFGQMVHKLRELPRALRESAQQLMASVAALLSSTHQQGERVARQATALRETQVTAHEIRQTSRVASQKAEAVLKVAERAEAVSLAGKAAIESSLGGLADIRAQVGEIAQKIAQLSERTGQISSITETVKGLADQSNMLALNAAIEAVRSGAHGKGFAVVAREIRSLADQSIAATTRVREILEDISDAIQTGVTITERGTQKVEEGVAQVRSSGESLRELSEIVQENAEAARQIAEAVGQQDAGITQIFAAITEMSEMMRQTEEGLRGTEDAAGALDAVAQQVTSVVNTYKT